MSLLRAPPAATRALEPPPPVPPAEPPAALSGRYLSQQMTQVITTEKSARMLATDKQMGPTGEGEVDPVAAVPDPLPEGPPPPPPP